MLFRTRVFKKDLTKIISRNESSFSHTLLWPILELAINCPELENFDFVPDEVSYLADDIIMKDSGEEICLLETSGKCQLKDIPRFGYDHIKGCFGVLSMFNSIIKENHMAQVDTISSLCLPFVHARGMYIKKPLYMYKIIAIKNIYILFVDDAIHLWSLELCDKKLYAFKKVFKATAPRNWNTFTNVVSLGILVWNLKVKMKP